MGITPFKDSMSVDLVTVKCLPLRSVRLGASSQLQSPLGQLAGAVGATWPERKQLWVWARSGLWEPVEQGGYGGDCLPWVSGSGTPSKAEMEKGNCPPQKPLLHVSWGPL